MTARHHRARDHTRLGIACLVTLLGPSVLLGAPHEPFGHLTIVAPGHPAGGWGQTARDMETVLRRAGLVERVEVVYNPGAGGTVGLAQFVHAHSGDPHVLLVGGLALVGSARANATTVSLLDTTPVARLFDEDLVVVVPGPSPLLSFPELVKAFRARPGATSWAAGHHGGADHLLVARMAETLGVGPTEVNFAPSPGGGEALRALLDNGVTAGVSGYAEVRAHLDSGRLRALAVSSPHMSPQAGIPTLRDQGVDIVMSNWRAVFAAPRLAPEDSARVLALVEAMVRHPAWRATLEERGWTDRYLRGDAFSRFLVAEHARIAADAVFAGTAAAPVPAPARSQWPILAATVSSLVAGLASALWLRRRRWAAPTAEANAPITLVADPASPDAGETRPAKPDLTDEIDRQFESWSLTPAEREVAHLILKGLRHKEIAVVRSTSERTVRHQALAIYRKAGLEGRTDLAAYFLEDLLYAAGPRSGAA